ncbi:MAG: FHA domain-containing protein [Planctomycetota bacterium]
MTGITIDELAESTQDAESQQDFVTRYPYPVMVEEPEDGTPGQLAYRVCPADRERNDGAVTLGRKQHQDIVVNDGMVSSLHAQFTLEFDANDERQFFFEDLGSSNGSWINGEKVEPNQPRQIQNKDTLRLGPNVVLKFYTSPGIYLFLKFYRRNKQRG